MLLLDKPIGPSSSRVLGHVKHLFGAAKAGHGGTLDPLASGLLPIMFGESTKYASQGLDADKTYEAKIVLGTQTSTGDAEGEAISRAENPALHREQVLSVLFSMIGPQSQMPPMFSALKKDGRPLYDYARKGQTVERTPREIVIRSIELIDLQEDFLTVSVCCSKGTYVRTLAEDIAKALGTVGHLGALRRTGVGNLTDQPMVTLDQIESSSADERHHFLKPVDWLIRDLTQVVLGEQQLSRFTHGQPVMVDASVASGRVRVLSQQQQFMGTGLVDTQSMLSPERVRVLTH